MNTTIADIRKSLGQSQPVLIDIQAWPDTPKNSAQYALDWDDGHYIVVVALDNEKIIAVDPSTLGSLIPLSELDNRWHDADASGKKMEHAAIFFEGIPQPIPRLVYLQ